jgi:hypothetical protein
MKHGDFTPTCGCAPLFSLKSERRSRPPTDAARPPPVCTTAHARHPAPGASLMRCLSDRARPPILMHRTPPPALCTTPGHQSSCSPTRPSPPRRLLLCSRCLPELLHAVGSSTPQSSYRPSPGLVKPTCRRLHAPVRATSVSMHARWLSQLIHELL